MYSLLVTGLFGARKGGVSTTAWSTPVSKSGDSDTMSDMRSKCVVILAYNAKNNDVLVRIADKFYCLSAEFHSGSQGSSPSGNLEINHLNRLPSKSSVFNRKVVDIDPSILEGGNTDLEVVEKQFNERAGSNIEGICKADRLTIEKTHRVSKDILSKIGEWYRGNSTNHAMNIQGGYVTADIPPAVANL